MIKNTDKKKKKVYPEVDGSKYIDLEPFIDYKQEVRGRIREWLQIRSTTIND